MVEQGDIDEFYSITLYPNGNKHFDEVLPEYIERLTEQAKPYVFGCTFEKYISAIAGSPEFEEWKDWLKKRYVVQ